RTRCRRHRPPASMVPLRWDRGPRCPPVMVDAGRPTGSVDSGRRPRAGWWERSWWCRCCSSLDPHAGSRSQPTGGHREGEHDDQQREGTAPRPLDPGRERLAGTVVDLECEGTDGLVEQGPDDVHVAEGGEDEGGCLTGSSGDGEHRPGGEPG